MREATNQVVDVGRLLQVMRIDLFGARVSIALAAVVLLLGLPVTFFGMYYWINLQRAYTPSYGIHSAFWIVLLPITVSAASNAFSSLHGNAQRISFLMYPGSVVEKFISRFLLATVGAVTATTLVYYAQSVVLMGLGRLVGLESPLFNLFCQDGYQKTLLAKKEIFVNEDAASFFKMMDLLGVSIDEVRELYERNSSSAITPPPGEARVEGPHTGGAEN